MEKAEFINAYKELFLNDEEFKLVFEMGERLKGKKENKSSNEKI